MGVLELEHHKPNTYGPKEAVLVRRFANQLATTLHIHDLRNPLLDTVSRLTRELETLTASARTLRGGGEAVARTVADISSGISEEAGQVQSSLEMTRALLEATGRVVGDARSAAGASRSATDVATTNREMIGTAIARLVEAKHFVGESGAQVDALAKSTRRKPEAGSAETTTPASGLVLSAAIVREALQWRSAHYDKTGEEHYNLISAYHKALRGSDPQGALYWLARMIDGGEDPMYIARRTVRFASEDVGLADPRALEIAIAARDAYHFLGTPEGELALAEAAVYLATAPKSNRVYTAWGAALAAARDTPAAQVPKHIRNAPTKLMKELGYGAGYQYAHSVPEGYLPQDYLPDEIADAKFYEPTAFGFEKEIAKRVEWWAKLKADGRSKMKDER